MEAEEGMEEVVEELLHDHNAISTLLDTVEELEELLGELDGYRADS